VRHSDGHLDKDLSGLDYSVMRSDPTALGSCGILALRHHRGLSTSQAESYCGIGHRVQSSLLLLSCLLEVSAP
jgi:hypothetical protein